MIMTKHINKILLFLSAALVALVCLLLGPVLTPAHAQLLPESREDIQMSFAPLVRRASPAVVNVWSDSRHHHFQTIHSSNDSSDPTRSAHHRIACNHLWALA